jgi:hypothetical protein
LRAAYRDSVQRALSAQESAGATQRALLEVATLSYREALQDLVSAPFRRTLDPSAIAELVDAVLAPFAGFSQELIASAIRANHSSCALRAFPEEARPDPEYLSVIRADLQSPLDEYERQVEQLLRGAPPSAG